MPKLHFVLVSISLLLLSFARASNAASVNDRRLITYPPISTGGAPPSPFLSLPPVPTDTQPRTVAFGQQVRVWTVWYLDTDNCTSIATGTITPSGGPQYGTVTSVVGDETLPPGYPCAGLSLPATTAYYVWTVSNPTTVVDYFHLHYAATNGTTADTDWQAELYGMCPWCNSGRAVISDPIDIGSGNVFEHAIDYETAGQNKLSFARYYNSLGTPNTFATALGVNWRSNYDRYISIISTTLVVAERPDGRLLNFTLEGGFWKPDTDVDYTLSNSGTTWTLTDNNDTVETYSSSIQGIPPGAAFLASIKARNGYTQTLQYANGLPQSVTDSFNRQLLLAYNGGALETVTTPDGLILTYAFNTIIGGINNQLTSVSYNTDPVSAQTYLYEVASLPFALTGIVDEKGQRYATWSYDQFSRGASSQLGNGADLTTVNYDDTTGNRTVINAFGATDVYKFSVLQTVPKITEIDRQNINGIAAATRLFTYDGNGYIASQTDWNGNPTSYINNTHGEPTKITEPTRVTGISYDQTFVHLPHQIATAGLTTTFTYDTNGNVHTRTDTDTTTQTIPYSTNGQTRTWTYTFDNFLLTSVQNPRTDLIEITRFGYADDGALTSITDALNHVTDITDHTPGGRPLKIVDPNRVTTTLSYDERQRLTGSAVTTRKGVLSTAYSIDPAGELAQVTLPDNSFLAYGYDTAHRLTQVTDTQGNYIQYTPDALGDITAVNADDSGNVLHYQHSATFDPLGRILTDIAGAGQTTTYSNYDNNGNVKTITDPLQNQTMQAFDTLNRLASTTDANMGVTKFLYDTHDRTTKVTDANAHATGYIYDGFGDVIQQASPDSGITVYYYDGDSNLTKKIDALNVTTNYAYDKLDRIATRTYPSDATQNVTYTYDQHGGNYMFGVGRLTTMSDAAGTLTLGYDERGNLQDALRTNGTTHLNTLYTYDLASRLSAIRYPSGLTVSYEHDSIGNIAKVTALPSGGGSAQKTITLATYEPFGPLNSLAYGDAETSSGSLISTTGCLRSQTRIARAPS